MSGESSPASEEMVTVAEVVFDRPLRTSFSYIIPPALFSEITPGKRVLVPLGRSNQKTTGFCVEVRSIPIHEKLKPIAGVTDSSPLISNHLLEFTRWISEYYLCGWGQVLQTVAPSWVDSTSKKPKRSIISLSDKFHASSSVKKFTPSQKKVLETLATQNNLSAKELSDKSCSSVAVIQRLVESGWLTSRELVELSSDESPANDRILSPESAHPLTYEQKTISETIRAGLQSGTFAPFLLHGVTGSGKTEVYLDVIQDVIAAGKQVIVMVPEISLTPQTVRRFQERFPRIVVLHSNLKDAERGRNWKKVLDGEVDVVIGARSAIFAPCPNLGMIVIDEEHENSFKQDKTPKYHGRDIAVKRARMLNIPILLGSATPSLESWQNAQKGLYKLLSLPNRVRDLQLPPVGIVDMRHSKPASRALAGIVSDDLIRAM